MRGVSKLCSAPRGMCWSVAAAALTGILLVGCARSGDHGPRWSLTESRVGAGDQRTQSGSQQAWSQGGASGASDRGLPPASEHHYRPIAPPPQPVPVTRPSQIASKPLPPPTAHKPVLNGGRPVVVVEPGDTLVTIAGRHKVSVAELMFTNGLRSLEVHPGQRLTIPVRPRPRPA